MLRERAVAQQRLDVGLCAVALVPGKAVGGEFFTQCRHEGVAGYLGDDAGGGNRKTAAVAPDDGRGGAGEAIDRQPVHQRMLRQRRQVEQCPAHGQVGGLPDIMPVDFGGVRHTHADFHQGLGAQQVEKILPLVRGQLFGIGQFGQAARGLRLQRCAGKDYRGGDDRTGQRTAPGFIHAGQAAAAAFPELAFKS